MENLTLYRKKKEYDIVIAMGGRRISVSKINSRLHRCRCRFHIDTSL